MTDSIASSFASSQAAATNSSVTAQDSALAEVDFNTYLKLLVTQLENQDPLDPMDPNEMTAQIATYSQIEQQIKGNGYLEQMAAQTDMNERVLAVSYIGKEALVPSNDITLATDGGEVDFAFELQDASAATLVQIRDEEGQLIQELEGGAAQGMNYITWDGTDNAGDTVPAGSFTVTVTATDADGKVIQNTPHSYLAVAAVEAEDDTITLILEDETRVDFTDARTVRGL